MIAKEDEKIVKAADDPDAKLEKITDKADDKKDKAEGKAAAKEAKATEGSGGAQRALRNPARLIPLHIFRLKGTCMHVPFSYSTGPP